MGSHYIPVGKIKIDKEILDIACPAAGYGETPPPPEIYCPVNGFYPDTYIPSQLPIVIPETADESITIICDASTGVFEKYSVTVDSGSKVFDLYDSDGNFISSVTNSSIPTIPFPTTSGYYTMIIYPEITGSKIIGFKNTGSSTANLISGIKIIFKTPNIITLNSAFQYMPNLDEVVFDCTLDYLEDFTYAFRGTSKIYKFEFKDSYPELISVISMFISSNIREIIFPPTCYLPKLDSMANFASSSKLHKIEFPNDLPVVTDMSGLCTNCYELSTIRLWKNIPLCTTLGRAFLHCDLRGEIIIPEAPNVTSIANFLAYNINISKVKFEGHWSSLSNWQECLTGNVNLKELEYPRTVNFTSSLYNIGAKLYSLQKLHISDFYDGTVVRVEYGGSLVLQEITGLGLSASGAEALIFPNGSYNTLEKIDCPNLRVSRLHLGQYTFQRYSKMHTLNIDIANSSFSYASAPQIAINAAFDSQWLNNFFSELPVVTNKTISVSNCDGFAGCDPSIATAKGWTVL